MTHVLDQQASQFPGLESQIHQIKLLYESKLWYQLSEALLQYIEDANLRKGDALIKLYEGFVKEFETKFDQVKFIQIANAASDQFPDVDSRVSFLRNVEQKLQDQQAKLLCSIKIATHKLQAGNLEETQQIIRDVSKIIERLNDLDPLVYSEYYLLCANYHAKKQTYEEFFKNGLQYLAYTHESRIRPEQKVSISVEMALAVLVSKKIYNFSELFEQKVFKALQNTNNQWIYELIGTFNSGDIHKYADNLKQFQSQIQSTATLKNNQKTLDEKIRIMAFLELIFSLPKNDRNVSFAAISKVTGLNLEDVEFLVMRCMSLELIKGTIDELDKIVRISWVVPRVLDNARIGIMKNKFTNWNETLTDLIKAVEVQTGAI